MSQKFLKGDSEMQNATIKETPSKQVLSFKEQDEKLLILQELITDKISKTTDEDQIKLYLKQVSQIASERLQLRKTVGYAENYSVKIIVVV